MLQERDVCQKEHAQSYHPQPLVLSRHCQLNYVTTCHLMMQRWMHVRGNPWVASDSVSQNTGLHVTWCCRRWMYVRRNLCSHMRQYRVKSRYTNSLICRRWMYVRRSLKPYPPKSYVLSSQSQQIGCTPCHPRLVAMDICQTVSLQSRQPQPHVRSRQIQSI